METKDALEITRDNMRDYGISVAQGRAYPCIFDGLKISYKRAIYGMHLHNKHQTVKVAELSAFALPYHPHPSSVADVIIALGDNGNKVKLMETQGNWGCKSRGIESSAPRYIGGYLSDLAESLVCDAVEYSHFVKGEIEKDEPEALPALVPICFINGLSGIPSGLPILNIPTLNLEDLFDYYINILSHKSLEFTPRKLPRPNLELDIVSEEEVWTNILKTGKGTLKEAPIMDIDNKGVITIYAIPGSKNVESIQKILDKENWSEKVDIRDESTDRICIILEKVPKKQCDMKEVFDTLYSKLQISENFNLSFFDKDKIYVPCSFDKVVKANLQYVMDTHKNYLIHLEENLRKKLRILEIIEDMKASGQIKKLSDMTYDEAKAFICKKYKVADEIASQVLQKPMSYLTKEHLNEIEDLKNQIAEVVNNSNDIYEYLLVKYKSMKKQILSITKNKFLETRFTSDKELW